MGVHFILKHYEEGRVMTHAVSTEIWRRFRGAKKVVSDVEESPSFLPSCLEMSVTSEENASLQQGGYVRIPLSQYILALWGNKT